MIFFFMIFFLPMDNLFTFHTFAVCTYSSQAGHPNFLSRIPLPTKHINVAVCAQKIAQAWVDKRHKNRGANHANHGSVQICFSAGLFNMPTCGAVFRNAGEELALRPQLHPTAAEFHWFTKALLELTRGVQVKYSSISRHQRETTRESALWHSVVTRKKVTGPR